MGALDYQRTVFGYHGCDRKVAEAVLAGGPFRASANNYDWLGRGIYFWEHGPARALQWAREEHQRAPAKIAEPAVVGAVIHLGRCFDLLDVRNTRFLEKTYPEFVNTFKMEGKPLPENRGADHDANDLVLRLLDCAMINWSLPFLEKEAGAPFQSVRGVFVEGEPAFPNSRIMKKSHIQIAVRDPDCILGVFRPRA